jgi:hypothetical protein
MVSGLQSRRGRRNAVLGDLRAPAGPPDGGGELQLAVAIAHGDIADTLAQAECCSGRLSTSATADGNDEQQERRLDDVDAGNDQRDDDRERVGDRPTGGCREGRHCQEGQTNAPDQRPKIPLTAGVAIDAQPLNGGGEKREAGNDRDADKRRPHERRWLDQRPDDGRIPANGRPDRESGDAGKKGSELPDVQAAAASGCTATSKISLFRIRQARTPGSPVAGSASASASVTRM